jgi:uncharacterized protein YceH (UPF0502 family)
VLGCLVEKQLTTPQQYPLTLNALALACSQTTNRDPVMVMDEPAVQRALDELKGLHLVRFVLPSHGKSVVRYRHVLDEVYGLDTARVALLAVLLLRGPQTPGELRTRTARMVEFDSIGALQDDLAVLADQGEGEALVRLLGRRPGQKEDRWQQLLAVESEGSGQSADPTGTTSAHAGDGPVGPATPLPTGGPTGAAGRAGGDAALEARVGRLESELTGLRSRVDDLTASLDALRRGLGG